MSNKVDGGRLREMAADNKIKTKSIGESEGKSFTCSLLENEEGDDAFGHGMVIINTDGSGGDVDGGADGSGRMEGGDDDGGWTMPLMMMVHG